MSANSVAPGAQQKRFAAYLERLAHAAGHLDRVVPLKSYCTGLLLPGERKLLRRDDKHAPVAVRELAMSLELAFYNTVVLDPNAFNGTDLDCAFARQSLVLPSSIKR